MLLDRGPSWWQGSWPQPVNQAQNLSEQRFGDSDLCELECDVSALAPVLMSFSRSVVNDQCSTSCGRVNFGFGSTIGFRKERAVVAQWVCARTRSSELSTYPVRWR